MKKTIIYFALFLFTGVTAMAQSPQAFNYQGVARNTAGAPLVSTTIGLRLTVHDGSGTGTVVYQETQTPTTNAFGLYNVSLGSGTVVSGTFSTINWGSGDKYLEVEIDPAGGASYTSAGTSQLLSVPYSIYANTANAANTAATITGTVPMGGDVTGTNAASNVVKLQGNAISATAPTAGQLLQYNSGAWTPATIGIPTVSGTANYISKFTSPSAVGNSLFFDNGTSVGLNTITPTSMTKLEVSGVGASGTPPYYQAGIVADGATTASASGIYGEGGWRGVYGRNLGTTGGVEAIGVLGRLEGSLYTTGYGVKGEAAGTGPTNYGLYGIASGASVQNIGVYGSGNIGFYAFGGSNGLYGKATTTGMTYSPSLVSLTAGIVGQVRTVASGRPVGVFGHAINVTATGQTGVMGFADSNNNGNYGVEGYAMHNNGTGANYAIYGSTDGSGSANYAGYFSGAIYAVSANAGIKAFKIDHPADPANKYLYHSSVESNDMMNIYNGNIVTDANGDATITLPSYFTLLNKDYKYQLTCIGQFAQAIVSEKISGNQFKIKTDKPNVEVSWQVAGVRQDPAANAYRIKDEVNKPAAERGTYLMPELYGYGPEMAPGYKTSTMGRNAMPAGTKVFPMNLEPVINKGDNKQKQ